VTRARREGSSRGAEMAPKRRLSRCRARSIGYPINRSGAAAETLASVKTAKVLGVTIPPTLLALADEVID
jgi:hypothetical protein